MSKKDQDFDIDNQLDTSTDQLDKKVKSNKNCCKRVSKFLFSHIGLILMVAVYAIAGAFLFELLEQHREAKDCQEGKGAESANIVNLKSTLLTYIQFNISSVATDTSKDNETVANSKIENYLTNFRDQVLDIRTKYRYTGQDCNNSTKWNLAGSLLFVVTIFTTIGYGHIAPVTWEGQIVCICYATIGIPLFLMFLSNISGVLGDMFRFLYARVCCRLCLKKKKKPKQENDIDNMNKQNDNNNNDNLGLDNGSQWAKDNNNKDAKLVDDNENLDADIDDEKVTVPLTITMIIFTLYIALGAVLFNQFEEWKMIEAAYFCFITLATIGFGDFVPGQRENDPQAALKLILGAIYLLFGMAIMAMCFDLMQEEIIAKFTWLGKKLGVVDKDEDDEEDSNEKMKEKEDIDKEKKMNENEKNNNNKKDGKPSYISDRSHYNRNSPAPSYSAGNDDKETMSRLRSSYLQNVANRQFK